MRRFSGNNYYYLFIIAILGIISFKNLDYVNRDGVLYFIQANDYIKNGFIKSLEIYNWPFYSIILAELSSFFSLSFLLTSKIINVTLYFLIFFFYFQSLKILNSNIKIYVPTLFFLSSIPFLDNYLNMVLRDPFAVVFFIIGLFFFLLTFKCIQSKNNYKSTIFNLLLANLSLVLAILFRVEYFILLLLNLFFILYIYSVNEDKKSSLIFSSLIFSIVGFCFYCFYLFSDSMKISEAINRISFIVNNLDYEIIANTKDERLNKLLLEYSLLSRLGFTLAIFIKKLAFAFGIINILILPFAIYKCFKNKSVITYFILCVLILILAYCFIYLFTHYELSTRYLLPALLIIYILNANFYSLYFDQNLINLRFINKRKKKQLRNLFLFLFFIFFLNTFFDKPKINKDMEIAKLIMNEKK